MIHHTTEHLIRSYRLTSIFPTLQPFVINQNEVHLLYGSLHRRGHCPESHNRTPR